MGSLSTGISNNSFLDQIGKPLERTLTGVLQNEPQRAESIEVTCARYKAAYSRAVDEITYLRALVHELCRSESKEAAPQSKD